MRIRKSLVTLTLDRIALKARCECSTQILVELCDDLISAEELLNDEVRGFVVVELGRISEELALPEDQVAKVHLKKIQQELIGEFAPNREQIQQLRERSLLEIDGDAGHGSFPA